MIAAKILRISVSSPIMFKTVFCQSIAPKIYPKAHPIPDMNACRLNEVSWSEELHSCYIKTFLDLEKNVILYFLINYINY